MRLGYPYQVVKSLRECEASDVPRQSVKIDVMSLHCSRWTRDNVTSKAHMAALQDIYCGEDTLDSQVVPGMTQGLISTLYSISPGYSYFCTFWRVVSWCLWSPGTSLSHYISSLRLPARAFPFDGMSWSGEPGVSRNNHIFLHHIHIQAVSTSTKFRVLLYSVERWQVRWNPARKRKQKHGQLNPRSTVLILPADWIAISIGNGARPQV